MSEPWKCHACGMWFTGDVKAHAPKCGTHKGVYVGRIVGFHDTVDSLREQLSAAQAREREAVGIIERLVNTLDELQDHHCGGMCDDDGPGHVQMMTCVNDDEAEALTFLAGRGR